VFPVIFIDCVNVKIRDGQVANRPIRDLSVRSGPGQRFAARDCILTPEHEQFGVLGDVLAQQHCGDGQQSSGQLIPQRHDHRVMISAAASGLLKSSDDFSSGTG
jgi:hypothetical protein